MLFATHQPDGNAQAALAAPGNGNRRVAFMQLLDDLLGGELLLSFVPFEHRVGNVVGNLGDILFPSYATFRDA